jgi:GntR family transcriptional repressor for pyruvate dehydrogenase complex
MKLKSVERVPLVDMVVDRLRESIERGGLTSGDRLPAEPELIAQLGVSRTVLREAIQRLQTIGLVSVRRGLGTYVADRDNLGSCARLVRTAMTLSAEELLEFIELREAVEAHAARCAASLATEHDVAELESLCTQMEDQREGRQEQEAIDLDMRFHLRMVAVGGNKLMRSVLEILHEFILEGMRRTMPPPEHWPLSRRIHMALVDAIRRHDPDAAERAIHEHMSLLASRLQERQGL